MAEKCWVCNSEININDTKCPVCGFTDIHKDFISKEDAENWMKTVVEPYRVKYNERLRNFQKPVYDNSIFDKEGSYRIGNNYNQDKCNTINRTKTETLNKKTIEHQNNNWSGEEIGWAICYALIAIALIGLIMVMCESEAGDIVFGIGFIGAIIVGLITGFTH